MKRYQIWDRKSTVITPSGEMFTAEAWAERYPWINIDGAKMVISCGIINGGCAMEFNSMKDYYKDAGANITDDMTDDEVLRAIEDYEDHPPVSKESTADERTAAALEALVMNSLATVNTDDPDAD